MPIMYRLMNILNQLVWRKKRIYFPWRNKDKWIILLFFFSAMIIQYGCQNYYPLSFSYREEQGKAIHIENDSLSMKVSGKYLPIKVNNYINATINFDNIETHGYRLELDTSQVQILLVEGLTLKDKYIDGAVKSATGKVNIGNRGDDYFYLHLNIEFDLEQILRLNKDSVMCLVKLPMLSDPIQVSFNELHEM